MSIELKNGAMINLTWVSDCYVDKHDTKRFVIEMVNGVDIVEKYDTAELAAARNTEVRTALKR